MSVATVASFSGRVVSKSVTKFKLSSEMNVSASLKGWLFSRCTFQTADDRKSLVSLWHKNHSLASLTPIMPLLTPRVNTMSNCLGLTVKV